MGAIGQLYGTQQAMTVTNLQSLANYATTDWAWMSARVDLTGVNAIDVLLNIHLTTANTAPANDFAATVYLVKWYKDAGGNWRPSDLGTATQPIATEGKGIQIVAGCNSPAVSLAYKTAQEVIDGNLSFLADFGMSSLPHGFSVVIKNFTGAQLSTGCIVDYTPIQLSVA